MERAEPQMRVPFTHKGKEKLKEKGGLFPYIHRRPLRVVHPKGEGKKGKSTEEGEKEETIVRPNWTLTFAYSTADRDRRREKKRGQGGGGKVSRFPIIFSFPHLLKSMLGARGRKKGHSKKKGTAQALFRRRVGSPKRRSRRKKRKGKGPPPRGVSPLSIYRRSKRGEKGERGKRRKKSCASVPAFIPVIDLRAKGKGES